MKKDLSMISELGNFLKKIFIKKIWQFFDSKTQFSTVIYQNVLVKYQTETKRKIGKMGT